MSDVISDPDYDVCVVGLGPTGLTMAHLLGLRGVKVLVLEREPEFYGMARAVYTDDECLRIMQNAGLADELHADMTVDLPVQWVRADGSVIARFNDPSRRNGWPTSNFLYQPAFEGTLERTLADRPGVTVRRGRAVLEVDEDSHGVRVTHQACAGASYGRGEIELVDGTVESSTARYVVACDGGRSTVRTQLGISMEGKSFPQRWLVIDLRARDGVDAFRHLPYFDFVCDPALPTVSCPQPDGRHRFEFMLHDSDETADFETVEKAKQLLSRHVDPDEVIIDRRLVYTFNALIATQWRSGRMLLAGDAAHMTPQFIGQGMNSGLRDADNLSWKLADVILRGADPALLDSYEAERRPHARGMIALSVFNKDVVSTDNPWAIRARDWGIAGGSRMPVLRKVIGEAKIKPKPRFKRGAYFSAARGVRGVEGALMPQPPVRTYSGRPVRFDDAVGAGWTLVGIGVDPRDVVDVAEWAHLSPTPVALFEMGTRPQGSAGDDRPTGELVDLETVDDSLHRWLRRAGARQGSVVVLRPDKYVFCVIRQGQPSPAPQLLRLYDGEVAR
ncbi:bifunctional 3-(3-hydroxy-phenyl)propionate/3-hydroxycinnamic acid hydroxylase [Flexivirga meconopsidis]|uniref:bifunctional 3-(3-hydroxy-phenyl)propionate/3-hydroxycinnamic acid hydroxylase MhpA n=1 Tax=Flexivirga meconopsidis TaxID=2977121 RepID=UPI00223F1072|nr:bifunctional 3-(3-hydroxy-phenyl)propionate/3-hydroxycinnamic acid hydroxylase [Flexivirga meconopsidis]